MTEINVLYNSNNYYVAEFPGNAGVELVDKTTGRGAFIEGEVAVKFRRSMQHLFSDEPSIESVDEFLGLYEALMNNPVVLH